MEYTERQRGMEKVWERPLSCSELVVVMMIVVTGLRLRRGVLCVRGEPRLVMEALGRG